MCWRSMIAGVLCVLLVGIALSACGGRSNSDLTGTAHQAESTAAASEKETPATTSEVAVPEQLAFAPPACPIDTAQASQLLEEPMTVDPDMTSGGSCQFKAEDNSDYLLIAWYEPDSPSANRRSLDSERQASLASGVHPTTPPGLGPGAVETTGLSGDGYYQDIIYWELGKRVVYVVVQGSTEREATVNEAANYLTGALTT